MQHRVGIGSFDHSDLTHVKHPEPLTGTELLEKELAIKSIPTFDSSALRATTTMEKTMLPDQSTIHKERAHLEHLNGIGSYFASADGVGPGAYTILIPTPNSPLVPEDIRGNEFNLRGVPRGQDDNASDQGQWGVAVHWITQGNWDLGFYHVNGHDKKPLPVFENVEFPGSDQLVPLNYHLKYFEAIQEDDCH